ncbi:hypothetical protein CDAR_239691 [Caerostris darwini]|uniref:Uncharacterized protein n=1 Tax=Caerostris darwini TaxID=1538125 RepID=A0AAV4SV84_9ARAC|nr:hypothetical protein CDAR_239691 [Caerostris darwini]
MSLHMRASGLMHNKTCSLKSTKLAYSLARIRVCKKVASAGVDPLQFTNCLLTECLCFEEDIKSVECG